MSSNALYDSSSVMYVLGALLKDTNLLTRTKYILTDSDFVGVHKIVFSAVDNLLREGFQSVDPQEIDVYLKQYPVKYETYKKDGGLDYLQNISSLVETKLNDSEFDYYYNRVKKFTILRDFNKAGIDTKQFYDPDVNVLKLHEENERFNKLEIKDIFDKVRHKIAVLEDATVGKSLNKEQKVGDNFDDLMESLRTGEQFGYSLDGDIFNFVCKGARLGKLYLYSAPTGHGKTRFLVGNACSLSLPYIQDGEIIIKEGLKKVVFIATEMDPDEIQTLVLAYVSGVDEEKILNNTYNVQEEVLIQNAIKLIKEYSENFIIEKISDPSVETVRAKLIKYVLQDDVYHIFYDYIFMSPSLSKEFKASQRDDTTLMMLANTLKEIAADYGVFVYTGTQVNREWEKRHFRNENNIAGSKAIADKIDFGVVAVKVDEEEKEKVRDLLRADGIKEDPNLVIDIYKNRRGRVVNAKLYRIFDYGTCRTKDLMLTDTNYNKIHGIGRIERKFIKRGLLDLMVSKHV
jgi:replicative DNA helicase